MRVCVIDDDDIYQFLLKKELRHSSLVENVTVFSDGQKAMDYFISDDVPEDKLPDVIFLDINMPIMNGWQFLEEFGKFIKGVSKPIIIYLVSSSFDDRDINRSKNYALVSDYIIKPVKRSNLLSVLEDIARGQA